jgi:hypothetical protein
MATYVEKLGVYAALEMLIDNRLCVVTRGTERRRSITGHVLV